jgi:hypothetical protein
MKRFIIAVAAIIAASPASAQCVWKWDCSTGKCVQVPICRSALDIPPPRPPEIPPIPAPTIRPIPTPTIPPIGTRQCQPRYICTSGQCKWQTVCE